MRETYVKVIQKLKEKNTQYLVALFVIYTLTLILNAATRFFSAFYLESSSGISYLENGLTFLLVVLHFITLAYSILYVILCLWKKEGIKQKLLKIAVLPICYLVLVLVGSGFQFVLDIQKSELRNKESYLEITYSVPSYWKGEQRTIRGRDEGISYFSTQNTATFDVYAETLGTRETLKAYKDEQVNNYEEQNCIDFKSETNLAIKVPYYCYYFKSNEPESNPYYAIMMMEYQGRVYEFLIDTEDTEDLALFRKICDSIQFQ